MSEQDLKDIADMICEALGEVHENEYIITIIDGVFWIEHKYVGSGEPLRQFITSLKIKP